jgi:hypothetical protein
LLFERAYFFLSPDAPESHRNTVLYVPQCGHSALATGRRARILAARINAANIWR